MGELLLKQNAASKQFRLTKIQVADSKHVETTAFRRNQVVKSKGDEDEILSLIKLHNTKTLQINNIDDDLVSMLKHHNHSLRVDEPRPSLAAVEARDRKRKRDEDFISLLLSYVYNIF